MNIDLSYVNASRLLVRLGDTVGLALVGCGGTGSWLAPSVVRVARLLAEKYSKRVVVWFVDPDRVEAKNVFRQNYCDAEIGRSKAATLAWRYGLAWGIEVRAVQAEFNASNKQWRETETLVLIGCVDRAGGRREIAECADYPANIIWLDCGNHHAAGQVLIGRGGKKETDPFTLPGFCSWLPLPGKQHPELLVDEPAPAMTVETLSCADMAMADSQGMAINQRVAAEASDYLVRLLLTRDLKKMATYIDLASGSTRSVYITPEAVCNY